jgi:hypothetical protein
MVIAIWVITALVIGLWSLVAWALHALLGMDAAALLGDLKPLIDQLPYGAVIEQWVPGWQALLHSTLSLAQTLVGWVGGAGPVVVWIIWGVGAALLVGCGLVLTLAAVLLRKGLSSPPGTAANAR